MTAANITTVLGTLTTTEGDIANTTVPSGEEWKGNLSLCNKTTGSVTHRVYLSDGTTKAYRTFDVILGAGQTIDVFRGEPMTTGIRVGGRAGASASIDYIFDGARRLTA
jgi:hypothetical protein